MKKSASVAPAAKKTTKTSATKAASPKKTAAPKPAPSRAASVKVKTTTKAAAPKKTAATKTAAAKSTAVKAKAATKAVAPKKTAATKPAATKPAPAKKSTIAPAPKAVAPRATAPTKPAAVAAKPAPPKKLGPVPGMDAKFLDEQRELLLTERQTCIEAAELLKAEADSLALEMEPGDIQFDEESGEGGSVPVDREVDLMLSAQRLAEVEEIDFALNKIKHKTYGACEQCRLPIPKARLRAIPHARLCVACKSGSLVSRR